MDTAYDILNITAHCKKKSCKIYSYIKKKKSCGCQNFTVKNKVVTF